MQVALSTAQYLADIRQALDDIPADAIERLVELLLAAGRDGRTVFLAGNGGSAATASHFACDLAKGTRVPGSPHVRAIGLADNAALLTAWANDLAYEEIFAEQLRNLCQPGDILIAISGSGNSPNMLRAAECARSLGATVVALTGGGGLLGTLADLTIGTPASCIQQVEDLHLMVQHLTCLQVRARL